MRASFNPEALAEAARWYRANGGAKTSHAFSQEIRRIIDLAVEQSGLGSPGPHGTSRLYLSRFPDTLIFRIQNDILRVIAIAHHSRRPRYWAAAVS
jgi:toxin ParE1/3/4